jgi:hypothetical protein
MKGTNLIFYIIIVLLNSFLYFSILFSYGFLSLIHILIFWLSFTWLLKRKGLKPKYNNILFSLIPILSQNLLLSMCLLIDNATFEELIIDFYGTWIGIILMLTSVSEFFIIYFKYSKYQRD